MVQMSVLDALKPEEIRERFRGAITKCGISTVEALKDDAKITLVTKVFYDELPTFPYKTLIKGTIGREGLDRLIFCVRDHLVAKSTLDLSILDRSFLQHALNRIRTKLG